MRKSEEKKRDSILNKPIDGWYIDRETGEYIEVKKDEENGQQKTR